MMWLKGCPKCRGDLYEEPAIGNGGGAARFVNCLQCGHTLTDQEERRLRPAAPRVVTRSTWRVA